MRRLRRVLRRLRWGWLLLLRNADRAVRWETPREGAEGLLWGVLGLTLFFLPWMILVAGMGAAPPSFWLLALLPLWGGAGALWLLTRALDIRPGTFHLLETALGILHISLMLWYAPSGVPTLWFGAFLLYALLLITSQSEPQAKPYFLLFSFLFLAPQFLLQGFLAGNARSAVLQLFLFSFGLLAAGLVYAFHTQRLRERLETTLILLSELQRLWRQRDFTLTIQRLLEYALAFFSLPAAAAVVENLATGEQRRVALATRDARLPSRVGEEVGEILGRMGAAGFLLARRLTLPLEEQEVLHLLFFRHPGERGMPVRTLHLLERYLRFVQSMALSQYEVASLERDPLTGARVRKDLARDLDRLLRERESTPTLHGEPFSVLMMDLDHFKTVNDTYGHPVGDAVLQEFVQRVWGVLRHEDQRYFYRYGGEEFVLILTDCDTSCGMLIAERILQAMRGRPFRFPHGNEIQELRLTVSIGLAVYPLDGFTPSMLLQRADERLYAAKRAGRDQVVGPEAMPTPAGNPGA